MMAIAATPRLELKRVLSGTDNRLAALATVNLLVIELLAAGALDVGEATGVFYNADNCAYVRRLKSPVADELIGRGVQLADLFDALSQSRARLEFRKELQIMRRLCKQLRSAGR